MSEGCPPTRPPKLF